MIEWLMYLLQTVVIIISGDLPFLLCCNTEGGGVATFIANP